MDVKFIDLRFISLLIGIGDDASDVNSTQTHLTGGTRPGLMMYNATDIWILLHIDTDHDWMNARFELEVFNYNASGQLNEH